MNRISKHIHRFGIMVAVTSVGLYGAIESLQSAQNFGVRGFGIQPAMAQRLDPDSVWQQIYTKLPDLPRENQYINRETGKVATDNTLVGRLIRYHIYLKGRSPIYRLDWKLTLADYLGVNGTLDDAEYPSYATLKKNPAEGDVAAINRLNRSQRDALIQALVDTFTPPSMRSPEPALPSPVPSPQLSPSPKPTPQPIRGAGGAQLLKF